MRSDLQATPSVPLYRVSIKDSTGYDLVHHFFRWRDERDRMLYNIMDAFGKIKDLPSDGEIYIAVQRME